MTAAAAGKDHFRKCWDQTPVYSGGAVATLVPTIPEFPYNSILLAMAFGPTLHLVRASDGAQMVSYEGLIEDDVILHLTANGSSPPEPDASDHSASPQCRIGTVAFSTESRQIYVFIVLWDNALGDQFSIKLVKSWTAAQHAISCLRFTPDGSHIASGATDGGLKVWDVHHHHITHNYKGKGGIVTAFNFSPAADLMAAGTVEGYISIMDFESKQVVATGRPSASPVEAVSFLRDGSLAAVGRDRRVALYQPRSLQERKAVVLRDHIACAAFSSDVDFFVGTPDGVLVQLLLAHDGSVTVRSRSPKLPHATESENALKSIAFIPHDPNHDRGRDASALSEAPDSKSHRAERCSKLEGDAPWTAVPLTVVADASQRIHLMCPLQAAEQNVPEGIRLLRTLCGNLDQIYDVRLLPRIGADDAPSPDNTLEEWRYDRVVASNSKDLMIFRTAGNELSAVLHGHSDIVTACDLSADGCYIVSGSKDTTVRLWELKSHNCIGVGEGHAGGITGVLFNPKMNVSSTFLILSIDSAEAIKLWNAASASMDAGRWRPLQTVNNAHTGAIHCLAMAPNDAFLATGGKDKLVNLWVVKGKSITKSGSFQGHRRTVNAVSFAPSDRILASASSDGSVKLWSLNTLTCARTLLHDKVAIMQMRWFNGGHQILTANVLGVLRVWAVAAGEAVATLEPHQDRIWALDVQEQDNRTVFLTGGADSVLVAHEDYTEEHVQALREGRNTFVLSTQRLLNAVRRKEWPEAVKLALALKHPRHLRDVISSWLADDESNCEDGLSDIIATTDDDDMVKLLEFTRLWISNARHSAVASVVVAALLRARHFKELMTMPAMKETIEALIGYMKRHETRVSTLLNQLFYVDYLTRSLAPVGASHASNE